MDPHDIALPAVIVFSGSRGSGKTYACITLMKHFETKKYITRTFLLCPTRLSNDLYSNLTTLKEADWQVYKNEQVYAQVYHKWLNCPHSLTLQEENLLEFQQQDQPLPITKPSHLLIVDDAQGTNLNSNVRSNILNHML